MKTNYRTAAFPRRPSATTVRLRRLVDSQQKLEIGLRIKELRDNSAETSRSIADYCEVSVEAVRNWIAGKGISYDNAQKVADLFERDVDYVWRGKTKGSTPDVMGQLNGEAATDDELREKLDQILDQQGELLAMVRDLHAEQERQRKSQGSVSRSRAAKRK